MAGRPCKACQHASRAEIDAALVSGAALSGISTQFGISPQALLRHRAGHVPTAAMRKGVEAVAVAESTRGASLAEQACSLKNRALALLSKAEREGDTRVALAGVREAARCIELMAKLAGEIDTSTTVNIAVNPQWLQIQTVILAALAPHPAARLAVAEALDGVR